MPLLWISLAFLTGITTASVLVVPIAAWVVMAVVSLVLTLPPINRVGSRLIPSAIPDLSRKQRINNNIFFPLLLLFTCLGAIRTITARPAINPGFIAYYNDQPVSFIVEGMLVEPPDQRDTYTNLRLQVQQLCQDSEAGFIPVRGLLLIRASPGIQFQYGNLVSARGQILTPAESEDFSYRDYLANRGIYSTMRSSEVSQIGHVNGNPLLSALYAFRQRALSLVYRYLPDPEASLLAGIILGVETGIPSQVQEAFRQTGTSHIIVISGFNITIIALMFTYLFCRFLGRYKGAIITVCGIILYTLLVGANAAVVRAAILGIITLVGHLIGRRQAGLNSLAFVAAVMAVITPTVLWDVSFQLSFAATLGILLYAEPMTDWFIRIAAKFMPSDRAEKLSGPVGEYFLITLAAQLTTLPLMAYYFKRISLSTFVANPLILPVQPPLMVLGGLAVLIGAVIQPLGQLFAWAAWPFAVYTIRVVEWLAGIPQGYFALGQIGLPLL
ncbi:MAG: ComEC/Rec2 family competence protein, partial [Acidobacteriaceae bacterium]